mmetsp:Transcript_1968/g.5809  ORF Transcript_1968/g.5809 Transcript_1968/m.5809 type:complete len:224 (+) Transcript_1968:196-867(+)
MVVRCPELGRCHILADCSRAAPGCPRGRTQVTSTPAQRERDSAKAATQRKLAPRGGPHGSSSLASMKKKTQGVPAAWPPVPVPGRARGLAAVRCAIRQDGPSRPRRGSETQRAVSYLHSTRVGAAHSSTVRRRVVFGSRNQRMVRTGFTSNLPTRRKPPGRGKPMCRAIAATSVVSKQVSLLWCSDTAAASRSICSAGGKANLPAKTPAIQRASMSATAQCEP